MWVIIGFLLVFVIGFYAGNKFRECTSYEGYSLKELYDQMDEVERKQFRSECSKILSSNRKPKCKNDDPIGLCA